MNRRIFIKNSGRWLILGGIGAVTGYLAVNGRIARTSECRISGVCSGCQRFSTCSHPQAKKQRENGG